MVSIFGIKLGKDRNKDKLQNPKPDKATLKKNLEKDKKKLRESQYNFSRPSGVNGASSPSVRPDTSYSTKARRTTLFHQPFVFPPASNSMVDLAPPPRRPSIGSLRTTSNIDLRRGSGNELESPTLPELRRPSAAAMSSPRPGTATSTTGQVKEFVNPFEGQFAKAGSGVAPDTPQTNATASPFSEFEFGIAGKKRPENARGLTDGYPSPPASINSADPLSPPAPIASERPSSSRKNQPSALRRVDTLDEFDNDEGPPTPERTVSGTSEDPSFLLNFSPRTEDKETSRPVVRDVRARRETLAFHQPRQPSMIMERWNRDSSDPLTKPKPTAEGFEGDALAFDFGEGVRASVMGHPNPLGGHPTLEGWDSKRNTNHTISTAALFDDKRSTRGTFDEKRSTRGTFDEKRSTRGTIDDKRSTTHTFRSGHPSIDTMSSAIAANWPSPPTDLEAPTFHDTIKNDGLDSPIIPVDNMGTFRFRDLPARPHTSGGPKANDYIGVGSGAVRSGSPEASFRTLGLDPPKGFLGRRRGSATGERTREPPKPLQLRPFADRGQFSPQNKDQGATAASQQVTSPSEQPPVSARKVDENGIPSPFGPAAADGNYTQERQAPEPPGRSTPMEGDFPVQKGLPRGRRPTFNSQESSESVKEVGQPLWLARQSAMPAPLSPFGEKHQFPSVSVQRSPQRPLRADDAFADAPVSPTGAPQLMPLSGLSLERSFSRSSSGTVDDFARSMEGVFDDLSNSPQVTSAPRNLASGLGSPTLGGPLISPVLAGNEAAVGSPMRMESGTGESKGGWL